MAAGSPVLNRRGFLASGGAAVAVSAVVLPGQAQAASTRRVTQRVAIKWSYDAKTEVTTVTRFRTRTVTARFAGKAVSLRARSGKWIRVPYVWSRRKDALVYSRALHLRLLGAAPAAGGGASKPAAPSASQPSAPASTPPASQPSAAPSEAQPDPDPDPGTRTVGVGVAVHPRRRRAACVAARRVRPYRG